MIDSRTFNHFACLQGSFLKTCFPAPQLTTSHQRERHRRGEGVPGGAGGGPPVPVQPGLPHLGVALLMHPRAPPGPQKEAARLEIRSARSCWGHLASLEIRVLS